MHGPAPYPPPAIVMGDNDGGRTGPVSVVYHHVFRGGTAGRYRVFSLVPTQQGAFAGCDSRSMCFQRMVEYAAEGAWLIDCLHARLLHARDPGVDVGAKQLNFRRRSSTPDPAEYADNAQGFVLELLDETAAVQALLAEMRLSGEAGTAVVLDRMASAMVTAEAYLDKRRRRCAEHPGVMSGARQRRARVDLQPVDAPSPPPAARAPSPPPPPAHVEKRDTDVVLLSSETLALTHVTRSMLAAIVCRQRQAAADVAGAVVLAHLAADEGDAAPPSPSQLRLRRVVEGPVQEAGGDFRVRVEPVLPEHQQALWLPSRCIRDDRLDALDGPATQLHVAEFNHRVACGAAVPLTRGAVRATLGRLLRAAHASGRIADPCASSVSATLHARVSALPRTDLDEYRAVVKEATARARAASTSAPTGAPLPAAPRSVSEGQDMSRSRGTSRGKDRDRGRSRGGERAGAGAGAGGEVGAGAGAEGGQKRGRRVGQVDMDGRPPLSSQHGT